LQQSIARERESVADARGGILGAAPRNLGSIEADVAASVLAKPSTDAMKSAMEASAKAANDLSNWKGTLATLEAWGQDLEDAFKAVMDAQEISLSAYNQYVISGRKTTEYNAWQVAAAVYREAAAAQSAVYTGTGLDLRDLQNIGAYENMVAEAQALKELADKDAQTALNAYSAAIEKYVSDMGASTETLGKLREETVAYYEAQKALAEGLANSAANLRSAAQAAQFGTLSNSQSLAQQKAAFAQNYSMALSTTGATKAGYADKMAAALPTLAEALKGSYATRNEWQSAVDQLAAQSKTVAGQLDTAVTAMDYQAESLTLLGTIGTYLDAMQSDAAVISAAVGKSGANMVSAISELSVNLSGKPVTVPALATGTNYTSEGLHYLHEGEAVVPRAYNPAAGGSSSNTERLERLVEAMTKELQGLRIETRADVGFNQKTAKLLDRVCPDGSTLVISGSIDAGAIA